MNVNTFYDSLSLFFRDKLRSVHTIKPAIVTAVNGNRISCQILTKTSYANGNKVGVPVLDDVPLFIYSANKGNARVTVPVSAGDNVIVFCSDRDYGDLLETDGTRERDSNELWPLGLYPLFAIPSFFTIPNEIEIDSENIVVENGSSKITIAPDGNIEIDTDADAVVNCANANVTATTNATISAGTQADITAPIANVIAATGLNVTTPLASFTGIVSAAGFRVGPAISPFVEFDDSGFNLNGIDITMTSADITADGISLKLHTHPYTDDGNPLNTGAAQ